MLNEAGIWERGYEPTTLVAFQLCVDWCSLYEISRASFSILGSFPGVTHALVLRPIRSALNFSALWSEYERTGNALVYRARLLVYRARLLVYRARLLKD